MHKVIGASSIGTAHVEANITCQDRHRIVIKKDYLIAIVSDGAGSAQYSQIGANFVCKYLTMQASVALQNNPIISEKQIKEWIKTIRLRLENIATKKSRTIREYACTLVCTIVSNEATYFIQIGDGAIVTFSDNNNGVVFWPNNGEYDNMTYFVTDENALDNLHITISQTDFSDIALFSDGIQRLALDYRKKVPHLPFFLPLFDVLKRSKNTKKLPENLEVFLGSKPINSRTDDDKTLILITKYDSFIA